MTTSVSDAVEAGAGAAATAAKNLHCDHIRTRVQAEHYELLRPRGRPRLATDTRNQGAASQAYQRGLQSERLGAPGALADLVATSDHLLGDLDVLVGGDPDLEVTSAEVADVPDISENAIVRSTSSGLTLTYTNRWPPPG